MSKRYLPFKKIDAEIAKNSFVKADGSTLSTSRFDHRKEAVAFFKAAADLVQATTDRIIAKDARTCSEGIAAIVASLNNTSSLSAQL
jgi:hypothetical protein